MHYFFNVLLIGVIALCNTTQQIHCSSAAPDRTIVGGLDSLLAADNIQGLTEMLRTELQNPKSPMLEAYELWLLAHCFPGAAEGTATPIVPALWYIMASHAADTVVLTKNFRQAALTAMLLFSMHYHIDAQLCLINESHNTETRRASRSPLHSDIKTRYAAIHSRMAELFAIIINALPAEERSTYEAAVAQVPAVPAPLHNPAWALTAKRDTGVGYSFFNITAGWFTSKTAGGVSFPNPPARSAPIPATQSLLAWQAKLYGELLEALGTARNWDEFFSGKALRDWFDAQAEDPASKELDAKDDDADERPLVAAAAAAIDTAPIIVVIEKIAEDNTRALASSVAALTISRSHSTSSLGSLANNQADKVIQHTQSAGGYKLPPLPVSPAENLPALANTRAASNDDNDATEDSPLPPGLEYGIALHPSIAAAAPFSVVKRTNSAVAPFQQAMASAGEAAPHITHQHQKPAIKAKDEQASETMGSGIFGMLSQWLDDEGNEHDGSADFNAPGSSGLLSQLLLGTRKNG